MALERDTVELPLYVGMGEGNDAQNRTARAVVSENAAFNKDGSVSTRRALDLVTSTLPTVNRSVVAEGDRVLVPSATGVASVDSDGVVSNLNGFAGAVQISDKYLGSGAGSSAWYRSVMVGDTVVTTWLSPTEGSTSLSNGRLTLWGQSLDAEGTPLSDASIISTDVGATYSLLPYDSTSFVVVFSDEFQTVTARRCLTDMSTVSSVDADVTTVFTSPERITRVAATIEGVDVVACVATGYSGNTVGTAKRGQTGLLRIVLSGSFSGVVLDDGTSDSNHYGANAFMAIGTSNSGQVWVGCGDFHIVNAYVYTTTIGTLTAATPTLIDAVYTWEKGFFFGITGNSNSYVNGSLHGYGPSMPSDGRFVFDGTTASLVFHGYKAAQVDVDSFGLSPPSIIPNGLSAVFGTQVVRMGSSPASGSVYVFPDCTLAGDPWVEDEIISFPAVYEAPWAYYITTYSYDAGGGGYAESAAIAVNFSAQVDEENNTPSSGNAGNKFDLVTQPLYACGLLCTVPSAGGTPRVTTLFGYDEMTRHSELYHEYTVPGSIVPPVPSTNAILASGSTVLLPSGSRAFVHGRRIVFEPAPYEGDGLNYGKYRVGWGVAGCMSTVGDPVVASGSQTADLPVLGLGTPAVVDKDSVVALVPPTVPYFRGQETVTGTSADASQDYTRQFAFAWAWVDSRGIRHRGPVSVPVDIVFNNWDVLTDLLWIPLHPPIALPGFDETRLVLEVYANPVSIDWVTTPDQLVLSHTAAPPSSNIGEPYYVAVSMRPTDGVILPLVYTTGGVLPNEAVSTQGGMVQAAGRLWTFDKTRVYYSKRASKNDPGGFNRNLFLDSPDGSNVTGISAMDEQVVFFTELGVFVVRGSGPNALGTGSGFSVHALQSPTGCKDYRSVLATENGVFFLGERGVHLLQRNMSVVFVGRDIEDSLSTVSNTFFDRTRKEVVYATSDSAFVFDTQAQMWTKLDWPSNTNASTWSKELGVVSVSDAGLWGIDIPRTTPSDETNPKNRFSPLRHSTPWVSLATQQSYQRCYGILVQGHFELGDRFFEADYTDPQNPVVGYTGAEDRGILTVKVFQDLEDEPSTVRTIDLRLESNPLKLRVPLTNQKCESVRVELLTSEANLDLTVTSVVALIGRKKGADKRQTTQGT